MQAFFVVLGRYLSVLAVILSLNAPEPVYACDICAIYIARRAEDAPAGRFQLGVAERFTSYTGQARSFVAQDDIFQTEQYLRSSITQFFLDYQVEDWLSFQLTYPYIYREYRRIVQGERDDGDEFGFGDLSLLAHVQPLQYRDESELLFANLFFGVKLPTGDSDRLREEVDPAPALRGIRTKHSAGSGTLVGGDDLTIGSGSTDVIFGASLLGELDRYFVLTALQYALRTEGSSDFQFGNELSWNVGPGAYLALGHDWTLSLLAKLSGESKADDEQAGVSLGGSSHDRVFLGPEFRATVGTNTHLEFGLEIPIKRDSTADGVEPEYRLNASVAYWF